MEQTEFTHFTLKYGRSVSLLTVKSRLVIRPAQPSDREAVFEFCKQTFDWGDYIPDVWDTWLTEGNSRVFTAALNGKPVGIMRVSLQKPGEAWMQAARTHRAYRRRGISTALAEACMEWARSVGAKIVRLSTDSDNYAAQGALQKLGFTKISDFSIMKCERTEIEEEAKNCRWAQMSDLEKIWSFLKNSGIYKESGGLYTVLFVWMSLDRQDLEKFVAKEKAIVHIHNGVVDGLVLIDETVREVWDEKPIQTSYIDGDSQAIVDMMRFFKAYAHQQRVKTVYAFAHNAPAIVEALTKDGFIRDAQNTEFIYFKKLAP
jgi:ribosomal protein S18 acetylase RimI-like enzyme